jgi:hypothetical protein
MSHANRHTQARSHSICGSVQESGAPFGDHVIDSGAHSEILIGELIDDFLQEGAQKAGGADRESELSTPWSQAAFRRRFSIRSIAGSSERRISPEFGPLPSMLTPSRYSRFSGHCVRPVAEQCSGTTSAEAITLLRTCSRRPYTTVHPAARSLPDTEVVGRRLIRQSASFSTFLEQAVPHSFRRAASTRGPVTQFDALFHSCGAAGGGSGSCVCRISCRPMRLGCIRGSGL